MTLGLFCDVFGIPVEIIYDGAPDMVILMDHAQVSHYWLSK